MDSRVALAMLCAIGSSVTHPDDDDGLNARIYGACRDSMPKEDVVSKWHRAQHKPRSYRAGTDIYDDSRRASERELRNKKRKAQKAARKTHRK